MNFISAWLCLAPRMSQDTWEGQDQCILPFLKTLGRLLEQAINHPCKDRGGTEGGGAHGVRELEGMGVVMIGLGL